MAMPNPHFSWRGWIPNIKVAPQANNKNLRKKLSLCNFIWWCTVPKDLQSPKLKRHHWHLWLIGMYPEYDPCRHHGPRISTSHAAGRPDLCCTLEIKSRQSPTWAATTTRKHACTWIGHSSKKIYRDYMLNFVVGYYLVIQDFMKTKKDMGNKVVRPWPKALPRSCRSHWSRKAWCHSQARWVLTESKYVSMGTFHRGETVKRWKQDISKNHHLPI